MTLTCQTTRPNSAPVILCCDLTRFIVSQIDYGYCYRLPLPQQLTGKSTANDKISLKLRIDNMHVEIVQEHQLHRIIKVNAKICSRNIIKHSQKHNTGLGEITATDDLKN